jgi:hypothetical protein
MTESTQRDISRQDRARRQSPQQERPKGLPEGQWRFDPGFGRRPQDTVNAGKDCAATQAKPSAKK